MIKCNYKIFYKLKGGAIIKSIKIILLFILLIVIAFASITIHGKFVKNEEIMSSDIIEEKITAISELATLKYNYKNVVMYENVKKFKGFNLPLTSKGFIIVYDGYLKAGVDLKNIDINISDDNSVSIKLNNAKILDNVINEESAKVYDEDSGLFNKLSYDDLFTGLANEKEKIEREVIEKGFLEEANKQTKVLLEGILESMGFENINIEFR